MQSLIFHVIEAQEPFLRKDPDRLVNRRIPHLVDDHGNVLPHEPLLVLLDLIHDLPEQCRELCVVPRELVYGFPERLYLLPELFLIDLVIRRIQRLHKVPEHYDDILKIDLYFAVGHQLIVIMDRLIGRVILILVLL